MTNEDLIDHVVGICLSNVIIEILDRQLDKGVFKRNAKRVAKMYLEEMETINNDVFKEYDSIEQRNQLADDILKGTIVLKNYINENFKF